MARPGNPSFGRGALRRKTQGTWRGALRKGPALSDTVRIHSPVNRQKPPARAGGCQNIQTQSAVAMWRGGAFEALLPHFKRQRDVPRGECLISPHGLKRHSQLRSQRQTIVLEQNLPQVGGRQSHW